MKASSIFLYQFGVRSAIEDVARSRYAWLVGMILTVSAGVARSYDQTLFSLYGIKVFFPLGISFIAAAILHDFYRWLCQEKPQPKGNPSFQVFLSLFWMTAPLAWIYAFPAERLYDSKTAAWINFQLLVTVSLWRVSLMTRALCVLSGAHPLRVLCALLLPGSFLMGVGSIFTSFSLMRMMGGLQYSPEERVISTAASLTFLLSACAFIGSILCAAFAKGTARGRPLAIPDQPGFPYVTLMLIFLLWLPICIVPQLELARNAWVQEYMYRDEYRKALDYMSQFGKDDFSPTHRLPPDPYEFQVGTLHRVFRVISKNDPEWIQDLYLGYLTISLTQDDRYSHWSNKDSYFDYVSALARMPKGRAWAQENRDAIIEYHYQMSDKITSADLIQFYQLRALLAKLDIGMPLLPTAKDPETQPKESEKPLP